MKLKHNKKRNTAFLYEVLVRNLTKAILRQENDLKQKLINLTKEHFKPGTEMKKELDIYNSLSETGNLHPFIAEKMVFEAKRLHEALDREEIFAEQSKLINKVNKLITKDAFNVFIPNYKSLASIYQIFDKNVSLKTKIIMEGKVIKNLIGGEKNIEKKMPPIDNLVFKSFIKKFNSKYDKELCENQKALLNKYILSFVDNSTDLKVFLNEEIARLKKEIEETLLREEVLVDEGLRDKISKVKDIINGYKNVDIDEQFIEQVLKIQSLVREI
jgi:hypothetical protein